MLLTTDEQRLSEVSRLVQRLDENLNQEEWVSAAATAGTIVGISQCLSDNYAKHHNVGILTITMTIVVNLINAGRRNFDTGGYKLSPSDDQLVVQNLLSKARKGTDELATIMAQLCKDYA